MALSDRRQTHKDTLQRNSRDAGRSRRPRRDAQIVDEQDSSADLADAGEPRTPMEMLTSAAAREACHDAVPRHQHNTIGTFRNNDVDLLAWQQL